MFLNIFLCLFCWFTCQSTALVMGGRSVHLTTLFSWASLNKQLTLVIRAHTFSCNWQQPFLKKSAEGGRMTLEINSWSLSTTVWDRAGIKLVTPGSVVRRESVVRNVTDCAFLWHDDGKMEFNISKLYFIHCLIFLTLIELLHENPYIFMHYHQCKNAV